MLKCVNKTYEQVIVSYKTNTFMLTESNQNLKFDTWV